MAKIRPEVYWQWKALRNAMAERAAAAGSNPGRTARRTGRRGSRLPAGLRRRHFVELLKGSSDAVSLEEAELVADAYSVPAAKGRYVDYNRFIRDVVAFFGQ
jgi:hypothetical protein